MRNVLAAFAKNTVFANIVLVLIFITGFIAARSMENGTPSALAVILSLIITVVIGLINGVLIGATRFPGWLVGSRGLDWL